MLSPEDSDVTETNCSNGEVRLVDHLQTVRDGRVEMCFNRVWGTVCRNQFHRSDAEVVCSQLSFNREGNTHLPHWKIWIPFFPLTRS